MLSALLTIADKYGIQTISPIVKERLADEEVLKEDAFGTYIVARRWGFANEAKAAARRLTLAKIMESPSSEDPHNLAREDFFRLLWFMQKRGDEAKRVIRTHFITWKNDPDLGVITCGEHSDSQTRQFYEELAEVMVKKFDVDPRLDAARLVAALQSGPDPPDTGFCKDIDSRPEREYVYIYCPLRPATMVDLARDLATRLESICEEYLSKALDGNFPA